MSKHVHTGSETVAPATATEKTFGSVWLKYCTKPGFEHSAMPQFRRALNSLTARLKYRHVRHIGFKKIPMLGYDVQIFDDDAVPFEPKKSAMRNLPEQWKTQRKSFVPKIAKVQGAILFSNGAALLPDKRFLIGTRHVNSPPEFGPQLKAFVYNSKQGDSALIQRHIRSIDLPGRCFTVRCSSYWNFAHFVHDALSRIYYEDLGAIVPGRDKVIAPPMPWPMQKALFHRVFAGYEIVQAPLHTPLRVEELLFPANLCGVGTGCNPEAIRSLANRMRRIVEPYAGRDRRKVCVSRRGGRPFDAEEVEWRNFSNVDAYETRMREMGYDVVEVSALDPQSQFELWANATDIVGIHGAGMMNMIMMPSGGNYTEIASTIGRSIIARCAMVAGHRVGAMRNGTRNAQGLLEIDLCQLEALLLNA